MQNVGQQYSQGAAPSHHGAPYGHTGSPSSSGSITSSLRQFRKKDVDKQHVTETNTSTAESHVARVAPHNHYPPRASECYRYTSQFPDYSLSPQVKYSEISDPQPLQEQGSPSVIQKAKGKEYMDMCNVQQNHMKQPYPDHLNGQQAYVPESNIHGHAQYPHKDPQVHPLYKPESQYFPKEAQYQQLPHQIPKYNMPSAQIRKYPTENDFLSKLRRIHPSMARSIMSDHHLQESQSSYQSMDQNRMYPSQNQRYMNYPASLQNSPYSHNYMPSQHYPNYPASCSYTRSPQMGPRFPSMNPHERSISPRRGYTENMPMPSINYGALPQKISPNYSQYNPPEYAQHYQHRRAPQEYYQQPCRTTQYLPHQMTAQEMSENRVTVSDSIKQYIENWADEETASEMNQVENNRLCKENLRVRDDQGTETVYMINASELQYLENGIPLVTSENGIPLVTSENGQYIIKSGVAIDNSTGMVRIVDKSNQLEQAHSNGEGIVNLHIMDPFKSDCMLAGKSNEPNQRQKDNLYDKPKVVIHQNTVIQAGQQNMKKTAEQPTTEMLQIDTKLDSSLPPISTDGDITPEADPLEKFDDAIFKECKKETVDKNCSPINVEQMESYEEFNETAGQTSVICPTNHSGPLQDEEETSEIDPKLKNMPIIDLLPEDVLARSQELEIKEEYPQVSSHMPTKIETKVKIEDSLSGMKLEQKVKEEKPTADVNHLTDIKSQPDAVKDCKPTDTIYENQSNTVDPKKKETESSCTENVLRDSGDCIKEETVVKEEKIESINQKSVALSSTEDVKRVEATSEPSEEAATEKTVPAPVEQKHPPAEDNKEISGHSDSTSVISSGEKSNKPKRSRRIFSVDDIINNIGNKSKSHSEFTERRRSLQLTREFLEKEVDNSHVFLLKPETLEGKKADEAETVHEKSLKVTTEEAEVMDIAEQQPTEELTEAVTAEIIPSKELSGQSCEEDDNKGTENPTESSSDNSANNKISCEAEAETRNATEERVELPTENIPELERQDQSSAALQKSDEVSNTTKEAEVISCPILKPLDEDTPSQNEVQYRNAIRVEESSVLIEIAGELVEISVNSINGKKVITVIPLSETTVVDFNDNYETFENPNDVTDQTKTDIVAVDHDDSISDLLPIEGIIPEADIIESTSEIIIGMDISLEEEIQLDLEKQPFLCTKAAKKAYENDLQIPSITTSEDFNDSNKIDSYNVNDKVSSSKEQRNDRNEKKRNDKPVASKKVHSADAKKQKSSSIKRSNSEKAMKDLLKDKKIKKDKLQSNKSEEEDFVAFKDLIEARRLKKLKLQQSSNEKVKADSTNKIDQEESNERKTDIGDKLEGSDLNRNETPETKDQVPKTKENKLKNYRKPPKIESKKEECADKNSSIKEDKPNPLHVVKPDDVPKINSCIPEKKEVEKIAKKVTFGSVNYRGPNQQHPEVRFYKLEDPRLKNRKSGDIIVPSVSEILKENSGLESNKRKLSLEEYNKRKRKLSGHDERKEDEPKIKKIMSVVAGNRENQNDDHTNFLNKFDIGVIRPGEKRISEQRTNKLMRIQRPKSLDDLKMLSKPPQGILIKRKFSLEGTCSKPNYFDWEETQSPKTNCHPHAAGDKRLSEFSGLINYNKSKTVIDINDLNVKPKTSEHSEDEILQTYKEQVDSKLSSLNIQIPRTMKPPNLLNPFSKVETSNLMERFLRNEKITYEEMEKVKRIISYKRLVQQLNKIKPGEIGDSPLNPTYEIKKDCAEKDTKLHLKKVTEKKGKKRFRNLYSESTSESDSDFSEARNTTGAYSVVQSNCFAAGVPKLIIKRNTEMPVPVVRLERLDLDLLVGKKRKVY